MTRRTLIGGLAAATAAVARLGTLAGIAKNAEIVANRILPDEIAHN